MKCLITGTIAFIKFQYFVSTQGHVFLDVYDQEEYDPLHFNRERPGPIKVSPLCSWNFISCDTLVNIRLFFFLYTLSTCRDMIHSLRLKKNPVRLPSFISHLVVVFLLLTLSR